MVETRESGTGAISLIWTAGDQDRTCPAFLAQNKIDTRILCCRLLAGA